MTTPPSPLTGEGDTVEQGGAPRRVRPLRTRVLVVVVAAGLLLAGVLVDHGLRQREGQRVDGCVRAATSAVRLTTARVDAIVSYVRPALGSPIPAPLRRRLHGLISVSVEPVLPEVRRAQDRCRRAGVLVIHDGLHGTRADCLRLLDRNLTYLREVVADGSRALGTRSLPAGRCTDR